MEVWGLAHLEQVGASIGVPSEWCLELFFSVFIADIFLHWCHLTTGKSGEGNNTQKKNIFVFVSLLLRYVAFSTFALCLPWLLSFAYFALFTSPLLHICPLLSWLNDYCYSSSSGMDSGETKSPSRWLGDTPFEQVSGTIISGHYWFLDVFPLCYEMQVPMFCRDGNLINLQWVLIKEIGRGLHI